MRLRSSRLFLLALTAGAMIYISDYKYWFVMRDYRVESQSPILERRLWEVFPKRCLTFWPYMFFDADGMKEFLERDMPVTVDTDMNGWGSFSTKIEWLKVWVKVEWRGFVWSVSRDGRMWRYQRGRQNDDDAGRLVWKIPDKGSQVDGITPDTPLTGVFKPPFSTEVIASFLDEFSMCQWYEAADNITWERRAGADLFFLRLSYKGGQSFHLYLQSDKYSGHDIGAEIDDLISRLKSEGGNYIIDATYEGKIVLRKL